MMEQQDNWKEWSRHVLEELKRLNRQMDKLDDKLEDHFEKVVRVEEKTEQTRASIKLIVATLITVVGSGLSYIIKSLFK